MTYWKDRFGKEEPAELKGKTEADIIAAMKEADNAKAILAKAEEDRKKLEGDLTSRNSEFEEMKKRMVALEANQKPVEEEVVEEAPSPWIDPHKFVQDATKETTGVALAAGMMSAKMYAMSQLSPRDAKIFKKYEKEIEQGIGTFAPVQRVMPQSWFNLLVYVKGLHEQEIAKAESAGNDFFSERGSEGGAPPDERKLSDDKLTSEEEEVCKRFHYDPKRYLENKKNGVIAASEKGSYARYQVPIKTNA